MGNFGRKFADVIFEPSLSREEKHRHFFQLMFFFVAWDNCMGKNVVFFCRCLVKKKRSVFLLVHQRKTCKTEQVKGPQRGNAKIRTHEAVKTGATGYSLYHAGNSEYNPGMYTSFEPNFPKCNEIKKTSKETRGRTNTFDVFVFNPKGKMKRFFLDDSVRKILSLLV